MNQPWFEWRLPAVEADDLTARPQSLHLEEVVSMKRLWMSPSGRMAASFGQPHQRGLLSAYSLVGLVVKACLFSLLLNVPFHTLLYFRDGSAQIILRAATLRRKLQIKAFHLTQSQYTDTGPTSPRADPITPGTWQGSHWNANV